ncbi:hypothetical protein CN231_04400 [Sinorhizobium meliloti]|nr:hypothetical protein CN231_04400 [Sinorhizobium meliloti]
MHGSGRRRGWRDQEKERIVAESYSGELSVSAVARSASTADG